MDVPAPELSQSGPGDAQWHMGYANDGAVTVIELNNVVSNCL